MRPAEALTVKPLMRGWSHGVAALIAIAGLVALIVITRHDPAKLVSMTIYGTALVLLFGVSATYHMVKWPPRVKDWLRRADHATIFVFIAATYTPLVFNVLSGWWRIGVLVAVWVSAAAGVAGAAPFLRIPRQVLAVLYLGMGWVAVIALVPLTAALGWVAAVLMALGGLQYSLGAAAYAFKKPRLWPRVFGYHELFHLAVISASVTFYVIVVHYAVPFHRAG
ncbi:MAG TPA: hemolysin III family protein [Candidatus Acidoferrum sp.]|nr:hemolysin III family protein [Candidatus Acidoferrum sp.]HXJ49459.1 hemolysin III family protein [Candidatus Acidoferrum sp.]